MRLLEEGPDRAWPDRGDPASAARWSTPFRPAPGIPSRARTPGHRATAPPPTVWPICPRTTAPFPSWARHCPAILGRPIVAARAAGKECPGVPAWRRPFRPDAPRSAAAEQARQQAQRRVREAARTSKLFTSESTAQGGRVAPPPHATRSSTAWPRWRRTRRANGAAAAGGRDVTARRPRRQIRKPPNAPSSTRRPTSTLRVLNG